MESKLRALIKRDFIMVQYVDDLIVSSQPQDEIMKIITTSSQALKMKKLEELTYSLLIPLKAIHDGQITLGQKAYDKKGSTKQAWSTQRA